MHGKFSGRIIQMAIQCSLYGKIPYIQLLALLITIFFILACIANSKYEYQKSLISLTRKPSNLGHGRKNNFTANVNKIKNSFYNFVRSVNLNSSNHQTIKKYLRPVINNKTIDQSDISHIQLNNSKSAVKHSEMTIDLQQRRYTKPNPNNSTTKDKSLRRTCKWFNNSQSLDEMESLYVDDENEYNLWLNVSKLGRLYETDTLATNCATYGQENIAYEGILNITENINCKYLNKYHDQRLLTKFVLNEISKRKVKLTNAENVYSKSQNMKNDHGIVKFTECSILKLVYSKEGKVPDNFTIIQPYNQDQYQYEDTTSDQTIKSSEIDSNFDSEFQNEKALHTPLFMGFTMRFKFILPCITRQQYLKHSVAVTKRVNNELFMYEHTFYPIQNQSTIHPSQSGSSKLEMSKLVKDHLNTLSNQTNTVYMHKWNDIKNKTEFSVLTFNIRNILTVQKDSFDAKHYQNRMKHIAKLCKQANADILSFQEIRIFHGAGGDWGPNQAKHLSVLLRDYQYVFQPTEVYSSEFPYRNEEGIAIFSKHPIISHNYILLSKNYTDKKDTHQRILLHVMVDLPNFGHIHVFNTHLSLSASARRRTVVEIWKYMRQFKEPIFLMGDFNAQYNNKEIKYFEIPEKGLNSPKLHDTWTMKHNLTDKGYTFNTLSQNLTKRLDMIFMRKHSRIKLLDVKKIDDGLRKEEAASDHIAVMAIFVRRKKE